MKIANYLTENLRFADGDTFCRPSDGNGNSFDCRAADGEAALAIHIWNGRPLCAVHSPFDNIYVPCTRCGEKPAPKPQNIEADPVCTDCIREMKAISEVVDFNNDEGGCKGFEDSCDNEAEGDDDFCADCHAKAAEYLDAQEGTTIFATVVNPDSCPGWGTDEDCGNPKLPGGDLCGDCHGARTDHESPRISH